MDTLKTMQDLNDEQRRDLFMAIAEEWNIRSGKDIANTLGVKPHVIISAVAKMRRAGIPLVRHTWSSVLTPEFVAKLKELYR